MMNCNACGQPMTITADQKIGYHFDCRPRPTKKKVTVIISDGVAQIVGATDLEVEIIDIDRLVQEAASQSQLVGSDLTQSVEDKTN